MSNYVTINRTYDAPRELLWAAWTDPEQVAQWWGPREFAVPRESVTIDARVGGVFELVMVEKGGEGREFPVKQEITELVEPERLVMRMAAQPEAGLTHETVCEVDFIEQDGKTEVRVKTGPFSAEMAPMADQGWNAQMDRLEDALTSTRAQ